LVRVDTGHYAVLGSSWSVSTRGAILGLCIDCPQLVASVQLIEPRERRFRNAGANAAADYLAINGEA
jgi:hypothetical protein